MFLGEQILSFKSNMKASISVETHSNSAKQTIIEQNVFNIFALKSKVLIVLLLKNSYYWCLLLLPLFLIKLFLIIKMCINYTQRKRE